MIAINFLTVGELSSRYGLPAHQIRRAVDNLGVDVPRIGGYRAVPLSLLPSIEAKLRQDGFLKTEPETAGQ